MNETSLVRIDCRLGGRAARLRACVALLACALSGCVLVVRPSSDDRGPHDPTDANPVMTHVHHAIDYIEFPVDDMAAAKAFYSAAFDWTFNDYGPEYAGIVKQGSGEMGGLRLDSEVVRGGPLVVLYSVDLDASLRTVEDAGGEIVVAPFDFPGGRRFQFTDPAGNELAVASYE